MMRKILLICIMLGTSAASAAEKPLRLSVDHGENINLSAPAQSVFIANPDIADVQVMSPTSIMIFGKRTGETTFMATDNAGHSLAQRTIIVMQDLSNLRQELDAAIPGNKIKLQALPNGIVLTGEAKDPGAVADAYRLSQRYLATGGDIINRIKVVGSNQIHIRVRFAEVSRTVDNTLGFDWNNLSTFGGFAIGIASGASAIGSGASILSTRPSNSGLGSPNDVIGISASGSHYNVNSLIDALAQDGLVTILAEPNLTAMSGETASFLAGGEFPIPIPQGNGTVTIEFKKYGISLEFTPTLISEDRINLHVKPEVSKLSSNGNVTIANNVVPSLTVRKAETTIEVGSGQSFAIAGLLDNDQTQTVNKYPVLGDIPVLGALFRSDRFQNGQSELVIIITPYIVKPSSDKQMALPTDGYSPPSETDRLLRERFNSSDADTRKMSGNPVAVSDIPPPAPPMIAAPVTAVTPATPTIPLNPGKAVVAPLRAEPQRKTHPDGPGGFILE